MHRLWNALTIMVGLWIALACGLGTDDRMVRRYAKCLADTNTALHRLTASSAVGTALSAERRGGGGEVACSAGARGVTMARSGPTTPATVNRCVRELRQWRGQKALGLGHNPVSKALLRG